MPVHRPIGVARAAILALVLSSACAGSGSPPASDGPGSPGSTPPATATPPPSPTGSVAATPDSGSPSLPAITASWAQVELVDVLTGEAFRIADLAGVVIVVEPMAVWCTNCKTQQREGAALLSELPNVAWIALDVDGRESPDLLASAARERGHPFHWAIAPTELVRDLEAQFGTIVLNPVPTPLVVIGTDGRMTLTEFGIKDAATLVALAREHGA